jgi:hypothetical protein
VLNEQGTLMTVTLQGESLAMTSADSHVFSPQQRENPENTQKKDL